MLRPDLINIPVCRFRFPKFPLDETRLIKGVTKDTDEKLVKSRKDNLSKIIKFLIRQTHTEKKLDDHEGWKRLKCLTFWEFLYEARMYNGNKALKDYSDVEREEAKTEYLNAISTSVQGTGVVILERKVKDIFVNGYNPNIMRLQICIDQYSCAQYF